MSYSKRLSGVVEEAEERKEKKEEGEGENVVLVGAHIRTDTQRYTRRRAVRMGMYNDIDTQTDQDSSIVE